MSLIVPINGVNYVADVGYGDLPISAMPIINQDSDAIIEDINGEYRAIYVDDHLFYIQKWKDNEWDTEYEAELEPRDIHDFDYNIEYNQTNPNSTFVKRLLVTMPKSYGRATMSQNNLTLTKQRDKEKYDVTSENYRQFLKEAFNLDVKINRLEP